MHMCVCDVCVCVNKDVSMHVEVIGQLLSLFLPKLLRVELRLLVLHDKYLYC